MVSVIVSNFASLLSNMIVSLQVTDLYVTYHSGIHATVGRGILFLDNYFCR